MSFKYLGPIIERHLIETKLLIDQINDEILFKEPVPNGRAIIDIILHIVRSLEFYSKGLATNEWKNADFLIERYNTTGKITELFANVAKNCVKRVKELEPGTENEILTFQRDATRLEILQEMLEHSIQHRGQILVYYKLLGIEPAKIQYII